MKKYQIIVLLFATYTLTSFTSPNTKKGIQFYKGSWDEVLMQAKQENKYIFVDIYASWCGPCKKLKRTTFKDEKAGAYFNKNFINTTIDGESKEGLKLAEKYNVRAYPTLLIIDHNGKIITKTVGFKKPRVLINFGRRVIP